MALMSTCPISVTTNDGTNGGPLYWGEVCFSYNVLSYYQLTWEILLLQVLIFRKLKAVGKYFYLVEKHSLDLIVLILKLRVVIDIGIKNVALITHVLGIIK